MVQVGQGGIGPAVIASLEDALRTHELVKVQLARQSEVEPRDAAQQLAAAVRAEVVQVIGKTATLYREKEEEEHS
jgi:RNA-binding protein